MSTQPASVDQAVLGDFVDDDDDDDGESLPATETTAGELSTREHAYTIKQKNAQLHRLLACVHTYLYKCDPDYDPDLDRYRDIGVLPANFIAPQEEIVAARKELCHAIVDDISDRIGVRKLPATDAAQQSLGKINGD